MVLYLFKLAEVLFYLMALICLIFILLISNSLYNKSRASRTLMLLRPIFVELLRGRTDGIAATIKVPNLVGELMDVDVPLHRVEQVRRDAVRDGATEYLLWMSILVCTSYEDVISFKQEIIELMKKDLDSSGLRQQAQDLATLCKYPVSPYSFFRIITCILSGNTADSRSLFAEIRGNAERYDLPKDITAIARFNVMVRNLKYFGLVILGLFISAVLLKYGQVFPSWLSQALILAVLVIIAVMLLISSKVIRHFINPRWCNNIEQDIKSNIPGLRIRAR